MNDNDINNDAVPELIQISDMERALTDIGFEDPLQRNRIMAEGFQELREMKNVSSKDLQRMAEDFGRRVYGATWGEYAWYAIVDRASTYGGACGCSSYG